MFSRSSRWALFLVTQKMAMPEPTNEQAVMQQKMMKYMTMFMGIMFYKVASGLCLYFIASSLWGIAERKLLPKPATAGTTDGGAALGGKGTSSPKPSPNGNSGGNRPAKVNTQEVSGWEPNAGVCGTQFSELMRTLTHVVLY